MVANLNRGILEDSVDEWAGRVVCRSPQMKRILLVDDEAHVLRVMKLSLDRNGYDVDTALSGEIALQMLRENDYQALIVDSDLPQMTSQNLCETVRSRHGESMLIFVIASESASGGEPESLSWMESMVNTDKPVSLRWIVARLNEFFGDYEVAGNS